MIELDHTVKEEREMLSAEQRRRALDALRDERSFAELAGNGAEVRELLGQYLREKASLGPSQVDIPLPDGAEIRRDRRGVPHISADSAESLFFAFGYAQAQDRLWQLDYLRRHAYGRLSEVYGRESLENDILSRTLSIGRIANGVMNRLPPEGRLAVEAFAAGVNAWMTALPAGLPAEFEMLGYEPEPWQPVDCLAIQRRWWWYLTGRLNVLSTPEAIRAGLGDASLVDQFLQPDAPVAYIVKPGEYDPSSPWKGEDGTPANDLLGGPLDPVGSNNWVAAPAITHDGAALLASDPHVYFTVPADWYEVHLHGAGYDVIGAAYPATPGVMFGRNQHLAWGITNNICSLRDLYIEEIDPAQPTRFRRDGEWQTLAERTETIAIRDERPYEHITRYAGERPIVNHLLPGRALPGNLWPNDYPNTALSLAWIGFEASDEIGSLLDLNRANTVAEAREAVRSWRCPTLNLVLADDQGDIGYQCVGAIPLRSRAHRGYRQASNPADRWLGTIPFDALPRRSNPDSGWVASANNPTAPPDFPYPLAGTWAPEDRAPRAEHLLETRQPHTLGGFAAMQIDVHSGRAERALPGLLSAMGTTGDGDEVAALAALRQWDFRLNPEGVGGAIFYVFYWRWHQRVVRERFPAELVPLVQDAGWGLTSQLFHDNVAGWFTSNDARQAAMRESFSEAIAWLRKNLGPEQSGWRWGAIHRLGASHPAARTPIQHALFDQPLRPHPGGASTLASAFYSPPGSFDTKLGANYRLLASLDDDQTIRAICWPGQSGQPGSPHYADQVGPYLAEQHFTVPYRWDDVEAETEHQIVLQGGGSKES